MVELMPFQVRTALATLAAATALQIEGGQSTGLLENFLMKHVMAEWHIDSPDVNDTIILGLARGDATVTEIKAAIETTQLERNTKQQAIVRDVLWESVRMLAVGNDVGARNNHVRIDVSLGGGKGIPFEKGDGWQWFAFNHGTNDQVAGATMVGAGMCSGVWL